MKTSNKLLVALLATIFTVPLLLAYSLKSKMKRGEHTAVKSNAKNGNTRSGSFTAFKVVKVIGPEAGALTCHLKLSANMDYKYRQQTERDSITVYTSNDTLFIRHMAAAMTSPNEEMDYDHTSITVHLPAFNNLVVDGAVVILDSLPASMTNLSVTLKNKGEVRDGSDDRDKESAKASNNAKVKNETALAQAIETSADNVAVGNDKGKIEVFKKVTLAIPELNLRDLLIFRLLYRN